MRRIADDLDKCLYESFHLNFVGPLPRALLEELAGSVASAGTGDLVEQVGILRISFCFQCADARFQVLDQYLSFIAPSPSLFSLLSPLPPTTPSSQAGPSQAQPVTSYTLLNSPSSTEQQIEEEIERISNGLFSAVVTMGECGILMSRRWVN